MADDIYDTTIRTDQPQVIIIIAQHIQTMIILFSSLGSILVSGLQKGRKENEK